MGISDTSDTVVLSRSYQSTLAKEADVLIVGGGLSGCLVARALAEREVDFQLIEARERLGGRILSIPIQRSDEHSAASVDLGPSWFWPHQSEVTELIHTLGMASSVYEQRHSGASVIEYSNGRLEHRIGAVSMAGSYRIDGGMQSLIGNVIEHIPPNNIAYHAKLESIVPNQCSVLSTVNVASSVRAITSKYVVLALPPRILADQVQWPGKSRSQVNALESVSTWMATEAKVTLIYDKAFWLDQGLSGDAMSQIGPMGEMHDASPRDGGDIGALFGFVLDRPQQRTGRAEDIKRLAIEQVKRMFRTEHSPSRIEYKNWSEDVFTATERDFISARIHASGDVLKSVDLGNNVIWAVSEAATIDAGYLEGAVRAAIAAVNRIE